MTIPFTKPPDEIEFAVNAYLSQNPGEYYIAVTKAGSNVAVALYLKEKTLRATRFTWTADPQDWKFKSTGERGIVFVGEVYYWGEWF